MCKMFAFPIAERNLRCAYAAGHGTRLKVLEAMALGTPVVATSKGVEGLAVTAGDHLLIGQ